MNWNNKAEVRKYNQAYRKAHRKDFLRNQRRYRKKNRLILNAKSKAWRTRKALNI